MIRASNRRLLLVTFTLFSMGGALYLIFDSLQDNLVFFFSPTEIQSKHVSPTQKIRVGGMVKKGSLKMNNDQRISFTISDYSSEVQVEYQGILPDLFREGQGVVAEGYLKTPDTFKAQTILAKHDERYMPPPKPECSHAD